MNRKSLAWGAGVLICVVMVVLFGGWWFLGTREATEKMGETATKLGTEALGSRAEIGEVRPSSLNSVEIDGIAIYDKQNNLIIKAESANIGFSLFGVMGDKPAKGISEVTVNRPEVYISQRDDGTWNYEDLVDKESEPSGFEGKVNLKDGSVTLSMAQMANNTLSLVDVNGEVDMKDSDAIKLDADAKADDATVSISGTVGDVTRFSIEGENIDIKDYLAMIPAGTLPEGVEIKAGKIDELAAVVERDGSEADIKWNGQAKLSGGKVRVLDTDVEGIAGVVRANESKVTLHIAMTAEGEPASVHGDIFMGEGGDEPRLALVAESGGLNPGKILNDILYDGKTSFSASITGTPSNPNVDGTAKAKSGTVYGYGFTDAKAHVAYVDGRIALQRLTANIFGGNVEAKGEFDAKSMKFDGTAKLNGLDITALNTEENDITMGATGHVSGDLGFAGEGADASKASLYGSVSMKDASFSGVGIPAARGSFYYQDGDLTLDYVSCALEDHGELGIEGTINDIFSDDGMMLDLALYGTHVNLAFAQNFEEKLNISGFGDFNGTVKGAAANPFVKVNFAAIQGKLFEQPYNSLHGSASGSMDGVGIDSFSMENGDGVNWLVKGTVGFTGERKINLQIDTMNVRMEDIVALVAPNQPLTGDVDNIITITGTLDNPHAVGYIHFDRGSYNGYLLSGMDGDYTLVDGVMTLKDFHIFSPVVDMDLNGTVKLDDESLNLVVAAHDIDLKRVGKRLPYPILGHGKFDGTITGTISSPAFDGVLDAPELDFNGVSITDVHGEVTLRGKKVTFAPLRFKQNGGTYSMKAATNLDSERLTGKLTVDSGDLSAILAMANLKNDVLHGTVNGNIDLGGSLSSPVVTAAVYMPTGDIAGYPVSDVYLDGGYRGRVLTLRRFEGKQGDGRFAAIGTVDLDGPIDATVSAQGISAGIIPAAAGSTVELSGTLDMEAQFGGTVERPEGNASISLTSGGVGASAFDTMTGLLKLRGSVIEIEQLIVAKSQGGHDYHVTANGFVPIHALTSGANEELESYDQLNLHVSLDHGDLGLLPFLSKEIEWAMGETNGNVTIGGTLAEPSIIGTVSVKDGSIKPRAMMVPLTELNVGIEATGDEITITNGSGKLGDGRFTVSGRTRLDGTTLTDYDLKLDAKKLDVETDFFMGPVTGSFELNEGEIFNHRLPKVTGHLDIDDVTISMPTIPESDGELPDVILDVDLNVGKHTHLYSPSLYDVWLADSTAHFGGTTRHPKTSGSIKVRRGNVTYLQTIFHIMDGQANFNQVDSFMPSIVFHAGTRLSRTRVFLSVEGPLPSMTFHLFSSPPMSQEEILKLLTLREAYRSGEDMTNAEMSAFLGAGLQMSFLGEITDTMRDMLKLDELTITQENAEHEGVRDNNGFAGYNVKLGKYVTDKIMIEYMRGINQDLNRVMVRYDFNDRFSIFAGRREDADTFVGLESRISF